MTVDLEAIKREAVGESRRLTVVFAAAVALVALTTAAVLTAIFAGTMLVVGIWSAGSGPDEAAAGPEVGMVVAWTFGLVITAVASLILTLTWQRARGLRRGGGRAIARQLGGRRVVPEDSTGAERRFCNAVAEIALAANQPAPEVWVLDGEHAINVFNAGWTDDSTVIGITTGALVGLDRDELQAVAAQAMSHVLHGDARLNLRLMAMVTGIAGLVIVGEDLIERAEAQGSSGWGDEDDSGGNLLAYTAGYALKVLGSVGVVLASAIQRSIASRHELLADATAVELTRDPEAMRDALRRVGGHPGRGRIGHRGQRSLDHLFLVASGRRDSAIHPPLPGRILHLDPTWTGAMLEPVLRSDGAPEVFQPTVPDRGAAPGPTVDGTGAGSPAGDGSVIDPLAAFDGGEGLVQFDTGGAFGALAPAAPALDALALDAVTGPGITGPDPRSAADPDDGEAPGGHSAGLGVETAARRRRDQGAFAPEIVAASRSPLGCRALVLSVAGLASGVATADLAERARRAGVADDELDDHLSAVLPVVSALDDASRAELVFLAVGEALGGADAAQEPFRLLALELVDAIDTKVLDGWILAQLLWSQLDRRRAADRRPRSLEGLLGPYAEVLTFLAVVGRADVTTAVSVGGYAADLGSVPARNPNHIDLRSVDRALAKLGRLDDDGRRRAIDGMLACIGADRKVRPVEARTVQALVAALGADIPVLDS